MIPWALSAATATFANHPHPTSNGLHLFYMHYGTPGQGSYDEDFCGESWNEAAISDSAAISMVHGTLVLDYPV